MDVYIESEMQDAVFHDPRFVDNFLAGDRTRLEEVLEYCRTSDAYNIDTNEWKVPTTKRESCLYGPILDILNTIGAGVHHVDNPPAGTASGSDDHARPLFKDRSSRSIPSDEVETAKIKPDIVLFDSRHEHWETVRMAIEIKKLPGHRKAGMKQLSRYARAVFAHQLHRRHLYGMMVCGTEATFVRFDRAGILYSKTMDLCKDADAFTCAFASLLMLDRADEGYDTAFTTRANEDGRLEYYINLPESAFDSIQLASAARPSPGASSTDGSVPTRKFEVIKRLCHRKSICGRATIVLHLREVLESRDEGEAGHKQEEEAPIQRNGKRKAQDLEALAESGPAEYVLKIIWRDPKRKSEGQVLERLQGMFGLAQHVWHCDVLRPCSCSSKKESCDECVDETAQIDGLMVCDNMKDITISVPADDEGEEVALEPVDTTEHCPTTYQRKRRI